MKRTPDHSHDTVTRIDVDHATLRQGTVPTNRDDAFPDAIMSLALDVRHLQEQAAREIKPVVDRILRTRSRDIREIEQTLDGLLDLCGHEPVLRMYKDLCRYYWDIDPAATAGYVNAYREYWDRDALEGQP
jgi:hypothetical protein